MPPSVPPLPYPYAVEPELWSAITEVRRADRARRAIWPGIPRRRRRGHDSPSMPAARMLVRLLSDAAAFVWLLFRPHRTLAAGNLFLRKQLAMYPERGVKLRRADPAMRLSLVLLSKCFDWRGALVIVTPRTLLRWHRAGFRLLWCWKFSARFLGRSLRHVLRDGTRGEPFSTSSLSWSTPRGVSCIAMSRPTPPRSGRSYNFVWRLHRNTNTEVGMPGPSAICRRATLCSASSGSPFGPWQRVNCSVT